MFLFWNVLFCVLSSFAIILTRKRERVALLYLSSRCLVSVSVLWLFLMVPWIGLLCMIVVFPYHTHLLFCHSLDRCYDNLHLWDYVMHLPLA